MDFLKAVTILSTLISIKAQQCPPTGLYMASTGRCLITKTSPLNWADAKSQCQQEAVTAGFDASKGGLVNVQTEEMQQQVKTIVTQYLQTKSQQTVVSGFWLGAYESSIPGATAPNESLPVWYYIRGCPSCSGISDFMSFGQGCYSISNLDTTDVTNDLPGSLTIETCTAECRNRGTKYALLRMGGRCYCSNSYRKDLPRNDCNSLCDGDRRSNCGGATADYVYYVNGAYNLWDANKPDRGGDPNNGYRFCAKIVKRWDTWKMEDHHCADRSPGLCELASSACQAGGTNYLSTNGRCYWVDATARNWWEARINCKRMGGDLAVLNSVAIHNATRNFMVSLGIYTEAWVGMTAKLYYWGDGQDLLYNNFTVYHPDRINEECVKMNADEYRTSDIGSWGDDRCGSFHPYICEIVINPPVTTTAAPEVTTSAAVTTTDGQTTAGNGGATTQSNNNNNNNNGGNNSGNNGAATTASNNNGNNNNGNNNSGNNGGNNGGATTAANGDPNSGGSNSGQPASGASSEGDGSSLGTFEIIIIVVICLLLLAILIAIILFVKYKKNNGNNSRVQPEKSYDARAGAHNPDSEEIYIPPSETGSTSGLMADPKIFSPSYSTPPNGSPR